MAADWYEDTEVEDRNRMGYLGVKNANRGY